MIRYVCMFVELLHVYRVHMLCVVHRRLACLPVYLRVFPLSLCVCALQQQGPTGPVGPAGPAGAKGNVVCQQSFSFLAYSLICKYLGLTPHS